MKKIIALILAIAVMMPSFGAFGESEAPAASEETIRAEQYASAFDEYDRKGYIRTRTLAGIQKV